MAEQIITPPTLEPVTVAEVKGLLRLELATDDVMIAGNIVAARLIAENITKLSLCRKSYAFYFDKFPSPGETWDIPRPPLISVASITYEDSAMQVQTWDPAEYLVRTMNVPARIVEAPGKVYPCAARVPGAVKVLADCGYDTTNPCPEHIRIAIQKIAAHFYKHPEDATSEKLIEVPSVTLAVRILGNCRVVVNGVR